jgi:hypothetical protein
MRITIKTTMGRTISEVVAPSDQVQHLKNLIAGHEGIPCDQQRLIFAGLQLHSEQRIRECGIEDKSTLHLSIPLTIVRSPEHGSMQINLWIRHLAKAFRLNVEESYTLEHIMSICRHHGWLHHEGLTFILDGRCPELGEQLSDYRVQSGDWLRLSSALAKIRVRSVSGDIWLETCLPIREQLCKLEEQLAASRPGLMFSFTLSHCMSPVDDTMRTLVSLGLEDGSELVVVAEAAKPPQDGWTRYRSYDNFLWWHNALNDDWFFEDVPDPWVQYRHPDQIRNSIKTWWWNSETHDWFDAT